MPREWRQLERAEESQRRRDNWYWKGRFDWVVFVPGTPGSQLKQKYTKEIKDAGFKVKVVEQSGATIKSVLQRSDPFREKTCSKVDCLVCRNRGKGSCRTAVIYELVCQDCKNKDVGETSRSAYTSRKEHLNALKRREDSSVMWRHM